MESYQKARYCDAGITCEFVQDNVAVSDKRNTIRGLHFQRPPSAQDKLVSVLRGAVLDVVVDIRHGSPTFGHVEAFRLSEEDGNQLFVPIGMAHGYCTLADDTAVLYKVSAQYDPGTEAGIVWKDPQLGICWPVEDAAAIVAERDKALPTLSGLEIVFTYD